MATIPQDTPKRPPLTSVSPVASDLPQKKVIGITGDYTEDWSSFFDLAGGAKQQSLTRCTSDETAIWSVESDEELVLPGERTTEEKSDKHHDVYRDDTHEEEEEEDLLGWDVASTGEGRDKFEAQLEGLRGILSGGLEGGGDPGVHCKWHLLVQAEEQAKAEVVVVVRYPKPTALFSLRTDDGMRFLQEIALEEWLKELMRKEAWPERARASRKARRAKAYSAEWSWAQVEFCLSLFVSRQFGCCLESCTRFFRVLGGVSQTIGYSLRTMNRSKRSGFDSWMTPEANCQWQQILRGSIMVLDIGVRALVKACCLQGKVEGKNGRTVIAGDVPYMFRGMLEKLKTWNGPVCDTLPLLTVEEAKGIAHQFASIPGLLAAQEVMHCAWPWEFAPPASMAANYSKETRLIEMVVAQLCAVCTKLEGEQRGTSSFAVDNMALNARVECLCSIELFLSGRSPITGSKSALLTDALDLLQVDLDAFVLQNAEQVEELSRFADKGFKPTVCVCLASVLARRSSQANEEELQWLELSDLVGRVRMHKLEGLYENIPVCFLKAKAAFTLALHRIEVHGETGRAEELLFESLYILDKLEDTSRRVGKFQELTLNTLKAYGDTLVANGKYKYALRAFKTAAEASESMEKEKDLSLTRKLCNACEVNCDWPNAMFYHVELLRATSMDTQLNEFVLISERVASICVKHQGDFAQAEAHLRMALSFLQNTKEIQGQGTALVLRLHRRLADVLLAANRVQDATHLLSDALQIERCVHGETRKSLERQGILMALARCALKLCRPSHCQRILDTVLNDAGVLFKGLSVAEITDRILHSTICGYLFATLYSRCCFHEGNICEALLWIDTFLGIESDHLSADFCIQPVVMLTMGQTGRLLYYRGKILQHKPSSRFYHEQEEESINRGSGGGIKMGTEACISSLWMALDSFEAAGDRMWQVKVLSLIVQAELSEMWKATPLPDPTNLDTLANATTRSITLCASLANAPQMVNCLINIAALRHFQQQANQSLLYFSEAVALIDTLYYGSTASNKPAMKFSAGMNRRVLSLLGRIVQIAFHMRLVEFESNKGVLSIMIDRWSILKERVNVQHALVETQTCALGAVQCFDVERSEDAQSNTHKGGVVLTALNRLSMNRYNQGGVDSMTRRGCLYRFKMLAEGEKCFFQAEDVKRQALEVLKKLMRLEKRDGVVAKTNTHGAKLFHCEDHVYAFTSSQVKQERLQLKCKGHVLSFEEFEPLYEFCIIASQGCEGPDSFSGMGKLLNSIGVAKLVRLVEAVIAEQPVAVVCSDIATREAVVSGLVGWLRPLQWQLLSLCNLPLSLSQCFGYHLAKMNCGYVIGMQESAIEEFIQGISEAKRGWDDVTVVHLDHRKVSFGTNIDQVVALPAPVEQIFRGILRKDSTEEELGESISAALQRLLLWTLRPLLLYRKTKERNGSCQEAGSDSFKEVLVRYEWISENADFLEGFAGTRLLQACAETGENAVCEQVRRVLREKAHVYRSVSSTELSIWAFVTISSCSNYGTRLYRRRRRSKPKKRWLSLNRGSLLWYKSRSKRKLKGSLKLHENTFVRMTLPNRYIAQDCFGLAQGEAFTSIRSTRRLHKKGKQAPRSKEDCVAIFYKGKSGAANKQVEVDKSYKAEKGLKM